MKLNHLQKTSSGTMAVSLTMLIAGVIFIAVAVPAQAQTYPSLSRRPPPLLLPIAVPTPATTL